MSHEDNPAGERDARSDSGDEDSTNQVKRLTDNQPLSDTHKVPDARHGEHRQYGVRDVDGESASEDAPTTRRGSDG